LFIDGFYAIVLALAHLSPGRCRNHRHHEAENQRDGHDCRNSHARVFVLCRECLGCASELLSSFARGGDRRRASLGFCRRQRRKLLVVSTIGC